MTYQTAVSTETTQRARPVEGRGLLLAVCLLPLLLPLFVGLAIGEAVVAGRMERCR